MSKQLPTDKEIREMADKNPTVAAAMLRQRKRVNERQTLKRSEIKKVD